MNNSAKKLLFDVRCIERNLRHGLVTQKEVDDHINSLADVATKGITLGEIEAERAHEAQAIQQSSEESAAPAAEALDANMGIPNPLAAPVTPPSDSPVASPPFTSGARPSEFGDPPVMSPSAYESTPQQQPTAPITVTTEAPVAPTTSPTTDSIPVSHTTPTSEQPEQSSTSPVATQPNPEDLPN